MRIQQKYQISTLKSGQLPAQLKRLGAKQESSLLMRDWVFTPDSRAFTALLIERYPLTSSARGLFLRLRETNDLTAREGSQSVGLYAYQQADSYFMDDQIKVSLDPSGHSNKEILRFFEMLGIDKVVDVTKKRDTFSLVFQEQPFLCMIDQVENLTLPYLEIHASCEKTEMESIRTKFISLRSALSIDAGQICRSTYHQLLLDGA